MPIRKRRGTPKGYKFQGYSHAKNKKIADTFKKRDKKAGRKVRVRKETVGYGVFSFTKKRKIK